jgi:hypothetical protein
MKAIATILMGLALYAPASAQNPKPQAETKPAQPCLAVSPNTPEGQPGRGSLRTFFYYLESSGLPLKDVKAYYKRKELEKLEQSGVRIVVTTTPSVSVRGNETQANTKSGSETNSSATSQTSAGCN